MPSILFHNIHQLVQIRPPHTPLLRGADMAELPSLHNAYLLVENGRIARFGPMAEAPQRADQLVDASNRFLLPAWVDSHTHLVFAGSRETEFADRIRGLSYQEIAARGGGILNSARRLRETPEEELFDLALERLANVRALGTGAIEIKSGYGLSLEGELKMLRVIRRLKEHSAAPIKASFLGAHALPETHRDNREGYLRLLINELLPRIAGEGLADYMDVFCEKVAFSPQETDRLLQAAHQYGLRPKIHVNQFYALGGIEVAVRHNALSVDHLEVVADADIQALQHSNTIATLLPSAPFFLNDPYPPARKLLNANLPLALATDYNPGSSPSGNMPLAIALACIKMRMLPEEAINAATLNGAFALELDTQCGSITPGKRADLLLTKPMPSLAYLPYAFGNNMIERVFEGER
jgi:imidazolonepropionase